MIVVKVIKRQIMAGFSGGRLLAAALERKRVLEIRIKYLLVADRPFLGGSM